MKGWAPFVVVLVGVIVTASTVVAFPPGDSEEPPEPKSITQTAPAPEAPAPRAVPASFRYPVGERLVYSAWVKKAGISAHVGKAVFTVTEDEGQTVLSAAAKGEKLGYKLDTLITTVLDAETHRPVTHQLAQRGSERRDKKLVFSEDGAIYLKVKHCREPNCQNPAHFGKKINWKGPIPWGKKRVHCNGRSCRDTDHMHWRERSSHVFDRPYMDMLSAIYAARRFDFDSDEPKIVPVINDRDRWLVKILVVEKKSVCEVGAGTFDAVQIQLEPVPTEEGEVPDEFRGLFGMHGTIQLWLDRKTRRPLKVQGVVPLGPFDIHANIELVEIGSVAREQ